MKKLLLGLLVLGSFSSFAAVHSVVEDEATIWAYESGISIELSGKAAELIYSQLKSDVILNNKGALVKSEGNTICKTIDASFDNPIFKCTLSNLTNR